MYLAGGGGRGGGRRDLASKEKKVHDCEEMFIISLVTSIMYF